MMPTDDSDFIERYRRVLQNYLADGGEGGLHHAYEIGRQALAAGPGLLDLINVHQAALAAVLRKDSSSAGDMTRRIDTAARFLVEALSPFEMFRLGSVEANAALRRLNQVLEEEAKRIAHALHDESSQLLATVYLELAELAREAPGTVETRVKRISAHLDEVRAQLRRLSHELRPLILDQLGLVPALQFLSDGISKRTGLPVVLEGSTEERLPQLIETVLYRVVQEALNNAAKHARATRVDVRVWIEDGMVRCTVRDNGVGFEPPGAHEYTVKGLGLIGIQERVNTVQGSVKFTSAPGRGTELRVSIPLER